MIGGDEENRVIPMAVFFQRPANAGDYPVITPAALPAGSESYLEPVAKLG